MSFFHAFVPAGRFYRSLYTAGLFLFVLSIGACFEPKEGCLDIEATNFNAAADDNCCCEYPELVLDILHRYGSDTVLYFADSLYPFNDGKLFRIKSVVFYLSDFQLYQNSVAYPVTDTVQLQAYAAAGADTVKETVTDDFLLVRRTPVNNPVGEFRPAGVFDNFRCRLGLSADAQRIIPALAPTGHPLRLQSDSLWQSPQAGYVFLRAVIVRDSMPATKPDTLSFTQADLPDFFIGQSGAFLHQSGGYDFMLKLKIDYRALFQGVDWTTGDIPDWKNQIVVNLPSVFSVSQ
jgi:hypothetical protein